MTSRFLSDDPARLPDLPRRRFIGGLAAGGVLTGSALFDQGFLLRDARAQTAAPRVPELRGTDFDLTIGEMPVNFTGRTRPAVTVNGSLPAPTLRWREGTTVELRVRNALASGHTSIHWHGIVLPANMDGVPGLSFDGIHAGDTYRYRFDVRQAGTYWYHSHSASQEQLGLYGALIIDPAGSDPHQCERDYVVLLSDWTDLDPARLFARLKKLSDYDNRYKRSFGDFLHDVRRDGLAATLDDRRMWGAMRMTPTDLSDVNANTYTYLMNGTTSLGNWTGLFSPGERVRLRFINGSSMTHFDVRIPGLKLSVIAADGQRVHPVSVDEFRIAPAETFDVIVEPRGQDAFTIFAQDLGRTGCVAGTLATREGLRAPVPAVDARPRLSMADMGHGGMGHGGMGHQAMDHEDQAMGGMKGMEGGCGASMGMGDSSSKAVPQASGEHADHAGMTRAATDSPLIDMRTMAPVPKLDDPGIGLRDNGRQVLSYSMLHSEFEDPDGRDPGRDIELHLTGHMQRFAWSFDGTKFSDAQPLRFNYGERLRIVLVNDTMMTHPIHLHGMWSDLEDENGDFLVRKHTLDIPPGSRRSYRVRADALGRWAYHCHLLYHMEAGMMREVRVEA